MSVSAEYAYKSPSSRASYSTGTYPRMMPGATGQRAAEKVQFRNRVLAVLQEHSWSRIAPHVNRMLLTEGVVLQENNVLPENIYFMERGMASLLVPSADGTHGESGVIGSESAIGATALLLGQPCFHRVVVQIPGNAYRIPVDVVRQEARSNPILQKMLQYSVHLEMIQAAQTAMCNRAHSVEERLSRWLLLARDRTGTDRLHITHEMMGQTVGARRSGVTVALGTLQEVGLVELGRGHVTVLDATGLQACACECYSALQHQFSQVENLGRA